MGLNPYLFIVGCPRSGTTLLRRMVDAHPEIAITRETHWIPGLAGDVTPELLDALVAHRRFAKLESERHELEALAAEAPTYAELVAALFDRYGAVRGKRLVGDKTPNYVRKIPLLHELFPSTRIVHIVRDGRDVALSALGWDRKLDDLRERFPIWDDSPVATAALWWRWHVLLGRRDGRDLPVGLYHELRYEALVDDPERECSDLCRFLDVEYHDGMVRFHEGRTRDEPGLSAKRAWLPVTAGLRQWREEMRAEDVEAFEAAAGDALEELGYDRAVPDPGEAARRQAAALTSAFPGSPLPAGW